MQMFFFFHFFQNNSLEMVACFKIRLIELISCNELQNSLAFFFKSCIGICTFQFPCYFLIPTLVYYQGMQTIVNEDNIISTTEIEIVACTSDNPSSCSRDDPCNASFSLRAKGTKDVQKPTF